MNDFLDLARKRFSARSYFNKDIEQSTLDNILEAARIAPTAANKQPFVIYIIKSGKIREKINETYPRDWMKTAPILLVICTDHKNAWKHPVTGKDTGIIDASIVIDHITLAAADAGLSTCWICNFNVELCSKILEIGSDTEPVALLTLGYSDQLPDINRHATSRKNLNDIIIYK